GRVRRRPMRMPLSSSWTVPSIAPGSSRSCRSFLRTRSRVAQAAEVVHVCATSYVCHEAPILGRDMRLGPRVNHVPWRPLVLAVIAALALGVAGRIAVHAGAGLPHGRAIGAVGHTAVALGAPWLAAA